MKIETIEKALDQFDRVVIVRSSEGDSYRAELSWSLKRASGQVSGVGKTAQAAIEQAISG